ncbi:Disks large -like protein 1 Embryo-dlg/synapse-associated protein 97 [Channa argus]|uniref:Disks large-like protein 1 Embryo-dlg/synapse-associated protein 97 n=1 Tax=Channa argus TaxID=215402 RepID=A0A6G1PJX0_CHAAH|nr:Disks large -like protein 1 Embryo-dlg/synapse-associated protein 97 [Channa argus]
MPVRQKDAQRALELLQQYREKLDQRQQNQNRTEQGPVEEDLQLQQSLDRVINVFQSQLFSALLDIQEYYELTILADSTCSVEQTDCPNTLPAPCTLPAELSSQPQASPGPLGTQAFEGPSQPKPLTPKPRSIKSPAPPIPSGIPATKPPSPTTQSSTPQTQGAKVKYRAPLPPFQSGASKPLAADTSNSSSPFAATTLGVTVNALETPSSSVKSPTVASLNGTQPHLNATNLGVSLESSTTSANPENYTASPDLNLVTVSALVSSTIQGLVSPTTPDKHTPTITTPSTILGPNRGTDAPILSQSFKTGKEPGSGMVTANMSPASPNQGKLTFSSHSPASPTGPLTKEPQLRQQLESKRLGGGARGQLPCFRTSLYFSGEVLPGYSDKRTGGEQGREEREIEGWKKRMGRRRQRLTDSIKDVTNSNKQLSVGMGKLQLTDVLLKVCQLDCYVDCNDEDDEEDESNEEREGEDTGLSQLRTVARRRGAEGVGGLAELGILEWDGAQLIEHMNVHVCQTDDNLKSFEEKVGYKSDVSLSGHALFKEEKSGSSL